MNVTEIRRPVDMERITTPELASRSNTVYGVGSYGYRY